MRLTTNAVIFNIGESRSVRRHRAVGGIFLQNHCSPGTHGHIRPDPEPCDGDFTFQEIRVDGSPKDARIDKMHGGGKDVYDGTWR